MSENKKENLIQKKGLKFYRSLPKTPSLENPMQVTFSIKPSLKTSMQIFAHNYTRLKYIPK